MDLLGLYLVACGLLAGAGLAKSVRPDDTGRALAQLVPGVTYVRGRLLVRFFAALEAAVGVAGIVYPNWVLSVVVATSFFAFAGFVLIARAKGGVLATCGCFGQADTPPTVTHAVVDAVFGGGAVWFAAGGHAGWLSSILSHQYFDGVPLLLASALCGWLAFAVLSPLARLHALRSMPAYIPGGRP